MPWDWNHFAPVVCFVSQTTNGRNLVCFCSSVKPDMETIVAMVSNTVPRPSKGVKFQPQTVCFWWLNGTNLEDSGICFFHPEMWRRILFWLIFFRKGLVQPPFQEVIPRISNNPFCDADALQGRTPKSNGWLTWKYPPREDKEKHRPKNHQFFGGSKC